MGMILVGGAAVLVPKQVSPLPWSLEGLRETLAQASPC